MLFLYSDASSPFMYLYKNILLIIGIMLLYGNILLC